jgi:hypothetical protein
MPCKVSIVVGRGNEKRESADANVIPRYATAFDQSPRVPVSFHLLILLLVPFTNPLKPRNGFHYLVCHTLRAFTLYLRFRVVSRSIVFEDVYKALIFALQNGKYLPFAFTRRVTPSETPLQPRVSCYCFVLA